MALSLAEFETLCRDGVLKPHAAHLILKPHLRVWTARPQAGTLRASGHVEIEGFLPNSVLRLAGFNVKPDAGLSEATEKKQVLDLFDRSLVHFLKTTFPQCQITVSPATILHQA